MVEMTPQEALNLLTQAAAKFLGTKADHEFLERAVVTLHDYLSHKIN